jgi:hypothetical protein
MAVLPGFEVGEGGEKGEEGREDVLAFGDPGDGFDAEGMDGPKESEEKGEKRGTRSGEWGVRSRKSAGGLRLGGEQEEVAEEEEEEDGGEGVEDDVDGMEGERVVGGSAEEGDVGHVGQPKERHVHGSRGVGRGEGGTDVGRGKSLADDAVLGDVDVVVEIDEGIADGGGEQGEYDGEEEKGGQTLEEIRFHGNGVLQRTRARGEPKSGWRRRGELGGMRGHLRSG